MKLRTIGGTAMRTSGKMISFCDIFGKQEEFQRQIISQRQGCDYRDVAISEDLEWFKYHCMAMVEEMGEVVKADKRWKTHRNERYEPEEKLDEIADVFITAINIAMFSGFSSNEVQNAIMSKIDKNLERLNRLSTNS